MSFLRALRKLVLGETWLLPIGLGLVVAGSALWRSVSDGWPDFGGFGLLAGVSVVLVLSVAVTARPPR
jgi:hypothetical protein